MSILCYIVPAEHGGSVEIDMLRSRSWCPVFSQECLALINDFILNLFTNEWLVGLGYSFTHLLHAPESITDSKDKKIVYFIHQSEKQELKLVLQQVDMIRPVFLFGHRAGRYIVNYLYRDMTIHIASLLNIVNIGFP